MVCIDDPKAALQIVELAQHEFPQAKLLVRSFDRVHAVELIRAGVDYQIRETVESAYRMGAEGLRALGFAEVDIEETAADIRQRDTGRLSEQVQRRRHVGTGPTAYQAGTRASQQSLGEDSGREPRLTIPADFAVCIRSMRAPDILRRHCE